MDGRVKVCQTVSVILASPLCDSNHYFLPVYCKKYKQNKFSRGQSLGKTYLVEL